MNKSRRANSGGNDDPEADNRTSTSDKSDATQGRETALPIRLNLDFMFGRGYLWAEEAELAPWLTLDSLRMEIPDLSFPLDARGGIARFQHKRCHLRDIELRVHRRAFADLLRQGAEQIEGFRDLQLRFIDQSIHVQVRLEAFGSDAFMSFRVALIPPEPPRGDELHLSLYEHRAFGPLPYPARLMAYELLTGLLNTDTLSLPGAGPAFQPGIAGDIVRVRPFRMMSTLLFPPGGWKIPNLRGLRFQSLDVQDDSIRLKGAVQDDAGESAEPAHALRQSQEGGNALAAYQAKDAFADADAALFSSDVDTAINRLRSFRDRYDLHPELVTRLLDALICDPTASRLAEARSLCRDLESDDPDSLPARLARPVISLAAGRPDDAADAYERLADTLRDQGELEDWVLAELAAARLIRDSDPIRATERLRDVLEVAPRHRYVLEELRDLTRQLGRRDELEEVLKRLAGVYTHRDALYDTYLELADLLLQSQGEVEEARAYLGELLQITPDDPTGLELLGTSYALSDQPVRAVQALSSAAREAAERDDNHQASRLHGRVARLWYDDLDNPEQALMSLRSGLLARPTDSGLEGAEAMSYGNQLTLAAEICERLGKQQEAIGYWSELVALLGRLIDRRDAESETFLDESGEPLRATTDASGVFDLSRVDDMTLPATDELPAAHELEKRLSRAQRHLAALYDDRGRPEAAASHWKRVVELQPGALDAIAWLDEHFRKQGRPAESVELMERLLERHGDDERLGDRWQGELHGRLARLHDAMHDEDAAKKHRSMAERLADADLDMADNESNHYPAPVDKFHPQDAPLAGEPPPDPDARPATDSQADYAPPESGTIPAPDDDDLPASAAESTADSSPTAPDDAAADDLLWGEDDSPPTERIAYERVRGFRQKYRDLMGNRGPNSSPPDADAGSPDRPVVPSPSDTADPPEPQQSAESSSSESADVPESDLSEVAPSRDTDAGLGDPHSFAHPRPSEESSETTGEPEPPDNEESPEGESSDEKQTDLGEMSSGTSQVADLEEESFPDPPAPSGGPAESYPDIALFSDEQQAEQSQSGAESDAVEPAADELLEDDKPDGGTEENWAVSPAGPESLDDEQDSEFSEQPETPTSQASPLPEQAVPEHSEVTEDSTLSSDSGVEVPSPDEIDEPEENQQADPAVDEIRQQLDQARRDDDHARATELLGELVDRYESDDADIDDRQHLRDRRDLGELLFFDLDRPDRAQPHLEFVRRRDPEGVGADRMVLSALETIYEDAENTDGRADILRARLETATSDEMRETYRMLLAQLHWESDQDAGRAERWLDEILNHDPTHEGAHRLYAEIAEHQGDYQSAADHLTSVLEVAGDGLDAVEVERNLGELLLEHLDKPGEAQKHFQSVLEESPGDARALEGIQACQRATGDSRGLLESLARELGLLIGRPQGISALEMSDVNPSEVDEAVRMPAAQILGDAAELVENELGDVNGARQLWETARRIWPDYVEALERRISLDRRLGDNEALATGLETLADQLIDGEQKVEVLRDAANVYDERLGAPDEARRVLGRALSVAQQEDLSESLVDDVKSQRDQLGSSGAS